MDLGRIGSRRSGKEAPEYFTGTVRLECRLRTRSADRLAHPIQERLDGRTADRMEKVSDETANAPFSKVETS